MPHFVINRITPGCSPSKSYAGVVYIPSGGIKEAVRDAHKLFWKRYHESFEAVPCDKITASNRSKADEGAVERFLDQMNVPTFTGKEIPPKRPPRRKRSD